MRDAVPDSAGAVLLTIARASIARALGRDVDPPSSDAPWALDPGASFVTLTAAGLLRGCIGSLEARRPLLDDVRVNAVAAATRDPRFPPVSSSELDGLAIEVSVLSDPEPVPASSLSEAYTALRPGVDGVIVESGPWHRATFLPQVWDDLRDPATFLRHLWLKAGLTPSKWSGDTALQRYTVRAWSEDR